jgi:HSP20 family molecular chaperone IbpA
MLAPTERCLHEGRIDFTTRFFTLSNKVNQDTISAQLNDGVLTLTLPKATEVQARKISIASLA